MKTYLEVREYKFEEGTTLYIKLDRHTKKASFVRWNGQGYDKSTFIFADRELHYMNGWMNILAAMQYVIRDVKKTMEEWESEEMDQMISLLTAAQDAKD